MEENNLNPQENGAKPEIPAVKQEDTSEKTEAVAKPETAENKPVETVEKPAETAKPVEVADFKARTDIAEIQKTYEQIRTEMGKVIVGQSKLIDFLIIAVLCEGHVLIEGMPGVAKTLSAKCLARTIKSKFTRIQFTPDMMPSDITGTVIYNTTEGNFNFKQGPIFTNVALIDEINRSPAKTQSALFECMEEQQVTIDGTSHKLASPFIVIATQNPVDYEGTYRLPEAQLDRFLFKLCVDYPTIKDEAEIISRHNDNKLAIAIDQISAVVTPGNLEKIKGVIAKIVVKEDLFKYIAQIVHETRNNPSIFVGASPRASVNTLMASKVLAAIQGRDFVTPEDIKEVLPAILNHRISLTPEKEMEGLSTDEVIKNIIQKVEVPR
ncbi:MAG: MoxR family ATPase [Flavobacteriales bacterium]|nr:MoxR family ATPase [Flavobacteriales bacterium]